MNSNLIISHINALLHNAANILVDWLEALLPRACKTWWDDCVIDNLSYNQQETAKAKGFTKLEDFDRKRKINS